MGLLLGVHVTTLTLTAIVSIGLPNSGIVLWSAAGTW